MKFETRGGGAVQNVRGRGGGEAGGRDEWRGGVSLFEKEYQSAGACAPPPSPPRPPPMETFPLAFFKGFFFRW